MLGRAFLFLSGSNKTTAAAATTANANLAQASQHLDLILNPPDKSSGDPHNIAALIGKACLAYSNVGLKSDKEVPSSTLVDSKEKLGAVQALNFFRRALRLHNPRTAPTVAAKIRLGLGYCLFRLEKFERAKYVCHGH